MFLLLLCWSMSICLLRPLIWNYQLIIIFCTWTWCDLKGIQKKKSGKHAKGKHQTRPCKAAMRRTPRDFLLKHFCVRGKNAWTFITISLAPFFALYITPWPNEFFCAARRRNASQKGWAGLAFIIRSLKLIYAVRWMRISRDWPWLQVYIGE
jgi:hypothetical protein